MLEWELNGSAKIVMKLTPRVTIEIPGIATLWAALDANASAAASIQTSGGETQASGKLSASLSARSGVSAFGKKWRFEKRQLGKWSYPFEFDSSPFLNSAEDLLVAPGTTIVFDGEAAGLGLADYEWTFNGQRIPGASSPLFESTFVGTGASGQYQVAVPSRGIRQTWNVVVTNAVDLAVRDMSVTYPGDPRTVAPTAFRVVVENLGTVAIRASYAVDVIARHASSSEPEFVIGRVPLPASLSPGTEVTYEVNEAGVELDSLKWPTSVLPGEYSIGARLVALSEGDLEISPNDYEFSSSQIVQVGFPSFGEITWPTNGVQIVAGSTVQIQWTNFPAGTFVKLELRGDFSPVEDPVIASGVESSSNGFLWQVDEGSIGDFTISATIYDQSGVEVGRVGTPFFQS